MPILDVTIKMWLCWSKTWWNSRLLFMRCFHGKTLQSCKENNIQITHNIYIYTYINRYSTQHYTMHLYRYTVYCTYTHRSTQIPSWRASQGFSVSMKQGPQRPKEKQYPKRDEIQSHKVWSHLEPSHLKRFCAPTSSVASQIPFKHSPTTRNRAVWGVGFTVQGLGTKSVTPPTWCIVVLWGITITFTKASDQFHGNCMKLPSLSSQNSMKLPMIFHKQVSKTCLCIGSMVLACPGRISELHQESFWPCGKVKKVLLSHSFSMKAGGSQGDYKCIWRAYQIMSHEHIIANLCVLWHLSDFLNVPNSDFVRPISGKHFVSSTLARGSYLWIPIVENSNYIPWATANGLSNCQGV